MFGQTPPGLYGAGIATVDQRHALALNRHRTGIRQGLGTGGQQCRDLRAGAGRLRRPPGGLADLGVGDPVLGPVFRRHLVEKGRLQGAGHGDGSPRAERLAEPVEVPAAELIGRPQRTAAAVPDGIRIEGHRLLAGAGEHDTVGHARTLSGVIERGETREPIKGLFAGSFVPYIREGFKTTIRQTGAAAPRSTRVRFEGSPAAPFRPCAGPPQRTSLPPAGTPFLHSIFSPRPMIPS